MNTLTPTTEKRDPTRSTGMPTGEWVVLNLIRLTFYLVFASIVSAVAIGAVENALSLVSTVQGAAILIAIGGVGCIPGMVFWMILLNHARTQPPRARKLAVATAPLVGLVWLVLWLQAGSLTFALVFGLFWPLGAGFVVRLDPPLARMPG